MSHDMSHSGTVLRWLPNQLSAEDVKRIRRRVRVGAKKGDLANEYGVNRKTIWRRLAVLERAEKEHAERLAEKRLRWQARRERLKLRERERSMSEVRHRKADAPSRARRSSSSAGPARDPFHAWLDRPKNLSGRALAEAQGLIRIRSEDGGSRRWVERSEVGAMLDAGWFLDD